MLTDFFRSAASIRAAANKYASLKPRLALVSAACALSITAGFGLSPTQASAPPELRSTIAFASTRDRPSVPRGQSGLEIYLMDADGTNVRRLTDNLDGEAFPALSPDGKGKIVFDSNRARLPGEPVNTSDLFIMNQFGGEPRYLTR